MNDLTIVANRILEVKKYLDALIGVNDTVKSIVDDNALSDVQNNMESLSDIKKLIKDHYRPLKDDKKAELAAIVTEEETWLKPVYIMLEYAKSRVAVYLDQKRGELQEFEQQQAGEPVTERKMMNRTENSTLSEKKVIADFKVTNQLMFVQACMDANFGAILIVDPKTETAFKRVLLENESMEKFPGCEFRRDYDVGIRKRSGY